MKDIWNYLKQTKKPIVLYGMGNGADKIISISDREGIKISGIFSSDGFVRKKAFHGMPVTDYKTAKDLFGDMIVLLCFGTALPAVIENIKKIGKENELYAPEVPVCGSTPFNAQYYKERESEFMAVYDLLCDDISRKTFKNIINYKLTGDINLLFDCETEEDEAYNNILRLSDSETYFDIGAYRGDTVLSFCNRVNTYNKIIAVEPDKKNYIKLCAATSNIKNTQNINAAVCDKNGTCSFAMSGSRGSKNANEGEKVDCITIDSLSATPTFIKIDIEGTEIPAINGGKDTIARFKPKMQIAAYHRIGDLADIPKAVLSFRNDYKVYLRHNPCLPAWDVNYFFL